MKHKDEEILILLASPNRQNEGFKKLLSVYKEPIYWTVRRMVVDHEETDDVVQEIFIKVFRSIRQFNGASSLYTWIYRIAINETLTYLKKKQKSEKIRKLAC